jgi:hypothetical protein
MPAWSVLDLIVNNPGELDAAMIADWVFPVPDELRIRRPFRDFVERADILKRRTEHVDRSRARVSAILGELVRAGLVQPMQPPTVAPWMRAKIDAAGGDVWQALRDLDINIRPNRPDTVIDAWADMLEAIEESPGTWRPAKTGAAQETYRVLCDLDIVIGPANRHPTAAGIARIMETA